MSFLRWELDFGLFDQHIVQSYYPQVAKLVWLSMQSTFAAQSYEAGRKEAEEERERENSNNS